MCQRLLLFEDIGARKKLLKVGTEMLYIFPDYYPIFQKHVEKKLFPKLPILVCNLHDILLTSSIQSFLNATAQQFGLMSNGALEFEKHTPR